MEEQFIERGMEESPELVVTQAARMYLSTAASWAKFLAIVGFVMVGLALIGTVFFASFMGGFMSGMPEEMGGMNVGSSMGLMVFNVLLIGLLFLPYYFMYNFARKTKMALNTQNDDLLAEALKNNKNVYLFFGIMMAITLGIYALALIVMLSVGIGGL